MPQQKITFVKNKIWTGGNAHHIFTARKTKVPPVFSTGPPSSRACSLVGVQVQVCLRAARRGVATPPPPRLPSLRRICTLLRCSHGNTCLPGNHSLWPPVLTPALGTPPFFLAFLPPRVNAVHISCLQNKLKPNQKGEVGKQGWEGHGKLQRHGQCTPAVDLSPLDPMYLHPRGLPTNTPSSSELKKPGFER